jgi:4a-hydroxytetrahydrobiopterin dehydratase
MVESLPGTDWKVHQRPPLLTRRYDFASYADTRTFLDHLTVWSERTGLFPDLSFGTTYVNITVPLKADRPDETEQAMAVELDALAARVGG